MKEKFKYDIRCPYCKSKNYSLSGTDKNDDNKFGLIYECNNCGESFVVYASLKN